MYLRTSDQFGPVTSFLRKRRLGEAAAPAPRVLTDSEVMDNRISVPAQPSLVRLSKSKDPSTRADAVGMFEEIKAGRLAGIYCVNWKKAALRAQRFGKYWWTVIPPGEDGILMLDPDGIAAGPPLIAFRRELDPREEKGCGKLKTDQSLIPSPARIDAALLKTWSSYKLWRSGQARPCNQQAGVPIQNIIPSLFCMLPQSVAPCPSLLPGGFSFNQWLQTALNSILGSGLTVNGAFDVPTRNALRRFQAEKGLSPSGVTDSRTLRKLQDESSVPMPCQPCLPCIDPGEWWQIIPKAGQIAVDPVAAQTAIDAIRDNRKNITLRKFVPAFPGRRYTAREENALNKATPEQQLLAKDYRKWVATKPWRRNKPGDEKTQVLLDLFEDIIEGEGDPSAFNVLGDINILTWGVGFGGGATLEKVVDKLFGRSPAVKQAFICNGITLTDQKLLAVLDSSKGVVVEDVRSPKGKISTNARLVIANDSQLPSLFVDIAQGVGFGDPKCVEDIRQTVVDVEFEVFRTIPTGQIPPEVWQNWAREPIALAGHNIHGGRIVWDNFKDLKDTSVRGVVATLGLKFGSQVLIGGTLVTIVSRKVTSLRVMTWGKGAGQKALLGPVAIASRGSLPSDEVMLNPPPNFGPHAWRSDFIYFQAPLKDKAANALRAKHAGERNLRVFYLAPKQWADKK